MVITVASANFEGARSMVERVTQCCVFLVKKELDKCDIICRPHLLIFLD